MDLEKEIKSGWTKIKDDIQNEEIMNFSNGYMDFLNKAKTEREFVYYARKLCDEHGFVDIITKDKLNVGDKVYYVNRNKSFYLAKIGEDIENKGFHVVGSHIDSPRLDLKPNPLVEIDDLCYLKTHYYGGIKKYQWTAIPLAIHGVVVKPDGKIIDICIGENDNEPIFTITDLLPHLAQDQMKKTLANGIDGENLCVLIGEIPDDKEKSKDIKKTILKILNTKYDITEMDLNSAELEIVPAFKARTLGLDMSMVAAYGQDDRVCSYTNLKALLDSNNSITNICILSDKEEIGSIGNTGMESQVFDFFISEILNKLGINRPNLINKVYVASKMLSADVDAGYDPLYSSVSDKQNAGFIGHGISINKYTRSHGKAMASDANAEYVAFVRNILEKNDIAYQVAELGKVDIGRGGTIAYILANKGLEVIDCGVPVLSMHSPYEVASKFDIYSAYKAYKAFYEYHY